MSPKLIQVRGLDAPPAPPAPSKWQALDLQDFMLMAGFVSFVAGVAFIYWPAGLIVAGILFFAAVYLIERAKRKANGNSQP